MMMRMTVLLCLFFFKSYGMDFVAEEGEYQDNSVKNSLIDLNKEQLKCLNAVLKESTIYEPDYTKDDDELVKLAPLDRLFILKNNDNKELRVEIFFEEKKISKIVYLNLTVPEQEKKKLDQLVRTLEKELQAKEKKVK